MFVVSVKLNKKRLLGIYAVACVLIASICIILPNFEQDVLKNNVGNSAKTTEQQVEFLKAFGYEVTATPVQIQEIIIPEEFDEEYTQYNEMQKISGFDLTKYKGRRVKKYTYKVTNYADSEDEVVANVLVLNGKAIGGDVCSTVLGGFVHGFVKE